MFVALGIHDRQRLGATIVKPAASYRGILELGPLSEDTGHEIMACLAKTCPWMPHLPENVRLERLELVLGREDKNQSFDVKPHPQLSKISGGDHLFGTQYRLLLQELTISKDADPAQTAGQLTVRGPNGDLLLCISLSLYRYFCVHALVRHTLKQTRTLLDTARLDSLLLTGSDLEHLFDGYELQYAHKDLHAKSTKEIRDYIRFINESFTGRGLSKLIVGTLATGLRLDTHPRNLRFISAPQDPFCEVMVDADDPSTTCVAPSFTPRAEPALIRQSQRRKHV